jgi:hypothetical protein
MPNLRARNRARFSPCSHSSFPFYTAFKQRGCRLRFQPGLEPDTSISVNGIESQVGASAGRRIHRSPARLD